MSTLPMHASAHPHLPVALDEATVVLALGAVVFGVIAYDLYRGDWLTAGGDEWQ